MYHFIGLDPLENPGISRVGSDACKTLSAM